MLKRVREELNLILGLPAELIGHSREQTWAAVFQSSIRGCPWLENQRFSPGRWAANYSLLYLIYRICADRRPVRVLEFGLGQSSLLLANYRRFEPRCEVVTVEHDQGWVDFFTAANPGLGLKEQLCMLPLEERSVKGCRAVGYGGVAGLAAGRKFDFVIIDGPYGTPRYSRCQVLDLVPDALADSFLIIMDDAERRGERQTMRELRRQLAAHRIDFVSAYYRGAKHQMLACSPDNGFFTGL